jgi:myo-inositol-1(or 4)-monophosphatase
MFNIKEKINHAEMEFSPEKIKELGQAALLEALRIHDELGESGLEMVQKNQFGETALLADIEAEKAVIEYLKKMNLPIRLMSEEHGETIIGDNPKYLGVLDGIDGTSVYKKARGQGKYATMLGIYDNADPKYNDYLFNGIMQHATQKLFYVQKGKGSFVRQGDIEQPIKTSGKESLDQNTRIYIDKTFAPTNEAFAKAVNEFPMNDHVGSTSVFYSDLASGEVDLNLECTFKGNLEKGAGYGLIKEAGGVMIGLDGEDIGEKKYLTYGQEEIIPMFSAATPELAKKFIEYLNNRG